MSFSPPPHPYPPDRYHGTTGEVSARLRLPGADHDLERAVRKDARHALHALAGADDPMQLVRERVRQLPPALVDDQPRPDPKRPRRLDVDPNAA